MSTIERTIFGDVPAPAPFQPGPENLAALSRHLDRLTASSFWKRFDTKAIGPLPPPFIGPLPQHRTRLLRYGEMLEWRRFACQFTHPTDPGSWFWIGPTEAEWRWTAGSCSEVMVWGLLMELEEAFGNIK